MSASNVLNVIPKRSTCTMFVMFTDELFQGFEIICNTLYRAVLSVGIFGISCTIDSAIIPHYKYLSSRHFLERDFTTAEMVLLNRVVVPCGSDSATHSLPQSSLSSLHTPSLDPFSSDITPENDLNDLPPTRTYRKVRVPSTVTYSYPC
jgi:hypothetical protein